MADQVHLGHIFHVAGNPKILDAATALVAVPDGALVVGGDGTIVYCGLRGDLPEHFDDPHLACAQTLFALLTGIRESALTEVYVPGRRVGAR